MIPVMFQEDITSCNFFIEKCHSDRIAANRVVLSIFSEFAMMNSRKPNVHDYNIVIESIQRVTSDDHTVRKRI